MVNSGSRMHVPSIVGCADGNAAGAGGFSLIAEDGNPLPGIPRVQSEVFMSAGKTYDVMINAPAAGVPALAVYDRELSLSANGTSSRRRHAGLSSASMAAASQLHPSIAGAVANPDVYMSVVPGETLTISDPSKGVIANDVNVYGVTVKGTRPSQGTFVL